MKSSFHIALLGVLPLICTICPPSWAGDPLFEYETVVPGYYLASGHGVAVDDHGNAYLIGKAYADHVHLDIVVAKIDPHGILLWEKFIVGNSHDWASDIVLDRSNNVVITGWTDSDDFPLKDAIDNTLTGFRDVFVMKLSGGDGTILYSTYLGGDYTDEGHGIDLSETGEIVIVGSTKSTDFPTTPNAFQGQPSAPLYIYSDAFITRLSASGDAVLYSTYFGGFKDDTAREIACDSQGNIVFAGETSADDFPLVNAIISDPRDLFVCRLSADGGTLQFSTYFGGEEFDRLGGMALGPDGCVFIAGSTRSVYFPTTPGAFQEDFIGEIDGCTIPFGGSYNCDDVYVTKIDMEQSDLAFSTYLGGTQIEECRGISVDSMGRAHVVGFTYSADFPPSGISSSGSLFVSRFDPTGSLLDYSVIKDSNSPNAGHGITLDGDGGIYFTGAVNVPAEIYAAKMSASDLFLSITSAMTSVPQNSNFLFDVHLANESTAPLTFALWTAVTHLDSGTPFEPLMGPLGFTLQAGETRSFDNVPQFIPSVPLGTYRYHLRAGQNYPGPIWTEDHHDLIVIP